MTTFKSFDLAIGLTTALDDNGEVFVTSRSLETALGIRENSVREIWASKSLKPMKEAALVSGKNAITKTSTYEDGTGKINRTAFYHLDAAILIATVETLKGNLKAAKLLAVGFGDSVRSLTLEKAGIEVDAADRERWMKHRLEHKKQFHPRYTKWLKLDGVASGKDYAKEVNRLKLCADLPLKPVQEYSEEELDKLNVAELEYNLCRRLGLSHLEALKHV